MTAPDPLDASPSDRPTSTPQEAQADAAPDRKTRRRRLLGVVVGAVVVLASAGVATNLWLAHRADQADLAAAQTAATEDARVVARASTAAESAFAAHEATVDLALAHLSSAAVPVSESLQPLADEVGEEHANAVTAAVEALTAALEPPAAADGTVIVRDANGGTPEVLVVGVLALATTDLTKTDDGPDDSPDDAGDEALDAGDEALDAGDDRLDGGDGPLDAGDDPAAALTAHYRTFEADDRGSARAEVAAEAERLDALADTLDQAAASVRAAVDDVEVAVVAAIEAVSAAGASTLETLEYADQESQDAFQAALDALEALAATELPVPWNERSVEQPSTFVGADEALETYATTAASAQESHEANIPPPPPPPDPPASSQGDGAGSGEGTRLCYRYSAWGGARLVLC